MLTSKEKIAEQILRKLRKYSVDSDIDSRELMLSVHETLAAIIRVRLFETKGQESQEVDGSFYYPINDISVLKNTASGHYYINLPSTSISLPFGVDFKRVGTAQGKGFIPVPNGFNDLHDSLPSMSLETQIGYYKSGGTLEFVNMTASSKPDTINIIMAIPFDALEEDDEINIPADLRGQVIDSVFKQFSGTLQMPGDDVSNTMDV